MMPGLLMVVIAGREDSNFLRSCSHFVVSQLSGGVASGVCQAFILSSEDHDRSHDHALLMISGGPSTELVQDYLIFLVKATSRFFTMGWSFLNCL
jgi:hypothetical protein